MSDQFLLGVLSTLAVELLIVMSLVAFTSWRVSIMAKRLVEKQLAWAAVANSLKAGVAASPLPADADLAPMVRRFLDEARGVALTAIAEMRKGRPNG